MAIEAGEEQRSLVWSQVVLVVPLGAGVTKCHCIPAAVLEEARVQAVTSRHSVKNL